MTKKKLRPFVSVCTPTFNRRPFIPMMFQCFKNQTYPKNRMEWIIVDDGTDKIADLIGASGIDDIKYVPLDKKISLGEKRNLMHKHAKGSIIVYMDDDDYYPPERISHAVERLQSNPQAMCAGSSEMYIYFKHIHKMYQSGPFGPNHATAATFAFRAELLKNTKYDDSAALAEEKAFLKDYTVPFVQLDPLKTILVFSHNHNSFDKRKLLEHGDSPVLKQSPKTVEMFITKPNEKPIYDFFMKDIDALLAAYAPGDPANKPDVAKQMLEIDKKRQEMADQNSYIVLQQPGKDPINLDKQMVVQILQQNQQQMQQNQQQIQQMAQQIQNLEKRNHELESLIQTLTRHSAPLPSNSVQKENIVMEILPKSEPEIVINM